MQQPRKIPMRTCIACREEKPKREMLRVVKNSEGVISLDFSGKLPGRGAYICSAEECIKKLGQKKLLNKAFSMPVEDAVYQRITEEFLGSR
ncbi:MAG: YlxR family protein [Clostridia bacterium]|nr:YlxR family protein [Clostridia bacterium]